MAENDVSIKFGATIGPVVEAIEATNAKIEEFKSRVESIGALVTIGFGVEAIMRWIESVAEAGEQTKRLAETFGITTEQVGQLDFIARSTGSTGEELSRTLEKLALNIAKAGEHASPFAAALEAMGLQAKNLVGVPLPQLLDTLRDRFQTIPEGMTRTAVAQALVRGGAETLLPILRLSDLEYRKLINTFDETGAAMSGPMASAFAETHQKIVTLETAVRGFGERLFSVLKPAIDAAITWITNFIESLDASHIAAGLSSLVDSVTNVILWIASVAEEAFKLIEELSIRANYLAEHGLQAFNASNVAAMAHDLDAMRASVDQKFDAMVADARAFAERVKDAIHSGLGVDAWGGSQPSDLIPFSPPSSGSSGVNLGSSGSKESPFQRAVDEGNKQVAMLTAQAAAFNLSAQDAAALVEQQKLLATATAKGNTLTDDQRIKIDEIAAAYGEETAKLVAAKERQQEFATVAGDFTTAITSWLDGTKSLGQAFIDLADKIALAVVEALVFDSIMAAFGFTDFGGGGPFGKLFGNLLFGGGKADGGPLDSGKWYIAGEHGPEPIWGGGSGAFAAGYGGGSGSAGGGGPPNITINYAPNVQALDATGVTAVLQRHVNTIASAVAQAMNQNPSLRPSF